MTRIHFNSLDAFEAKDLMAWIDSINTPDGPEIEYTCSPIDDLVCDLTIVSSYLKVEINKSSLVIKFDGMSDYYWIDWDRFNEVTFK